MLRVLSKLMLVIILVTAFSACNLDKGKVQRVNVAALDLNETDSVYGDDDESEGDDDEPTYEYEGDWGPIYLPIWHALLEEHAKLGDNLLDYGDAADGYYEDYNTNGGIDIAFPGTEHGYFHAFKCFPLKNGGMKVYEYVAWVLGEAAAYEEITFEPSFSFNCYLYDLGTLTPMPLEPELAECVADLSLYRYSPVWFTKNGIMVDERYTEFVWNGEKMVKK